MAFVRVGGVILGEGGGSVTPTFTETIICDNTALSTGNLTFTEDYADYDFLRFEIYYPNNSTTYVIPTIPEIVTNIKTRGNNYITLQPTGIGWNCARYTISNDHLTWTKQSSTGDLIIKNVYGLTCTNMTVTKDTIYTRPNNSSSEVTIAPLQSLWDYTSLFFSAVNDSYNENIPCYTPINIGDGQAINASGTFVTPYNRLSGYILTAYMTEHSITNNSYLGDVIAVKFT